MESIKGFLSLMSTNLIYCNFINSYHLPYTGNSNGYKDTECYISTLSIYKAIFCEEPPTCAWPPQEARFNPDNFNYVYINLIRLAGMYNAYNQASFASLQMLSNTQTNFPVDAKAEPSIEHETSERKELIKSKHKQRTVSKTYTRNDDIFLSNGGLLFVGNPYCYNYNSHNFYRGLVDGLHDDLHILDKVYFDDVLENGIGEFGSLANLDLPDIDFGNLLHELDHIIIKNNNWFGFWFCF